MSDTLKQVIEFLAVPLGAVAELPHHLIINNHPVKPDKIDLPAGFEFVASDTINLSVRNISSSSGTCQALVQSWHPIERSFGLNPDDGTFSQHLNPQPFVGGGGSSAASSGAFPVVVLRPGGVATQNVVTTWPDAIVMLSLLQGFRVLEFDDSIVSPIVIPAGTYDMTNVIWSGNEGISAPEVQVPEGVVFTGLRQFTDRVHVTFTGTAPPITDLDVSTPVSDTVTVERGATLTMAGAGPFIRLSTAAGTTPTLLLDTGGSIETGSHATIDLAVLGTAISVSVGNGASLGDDTVSGIAATDLTVLVSDSGALLASEDQSAFAGTITEQNATKTRFYPFPSASTVVNADTVLTDSSVLVLVDLGAVDDFTITLPPAINHRGETIIFKTNDSAEVNVSVVAAPGDALDGAITLTAPLVALHVTSDGVSTWYRTAEYNP